MDENPQPLEQETTEHTPAVPQSQLNPFEEAEAQLNRENLENSKEEEEPNKKEEKKTHPEPKKGKEVKDGKKPDPEIKSVPSEEMESFKEELDKAKKNLSEAQKWGTRNAQKNKTALRELDAFLQENSEFLEGETEHLKKIVDILKADSDEEIESFMAKEESPLQRYYRIANQEVQNMQRYLEDDTIPLQQRAFNFYIRDLDEEGMESLLREFKGIEDDPVKLTKRMLQIGKEYYESGYKELEESGGFRKYTERKNKEINKLNEEIKTLKKRLSEYENFDTITHNHLPEIGGPVDGDEDKSLTPFEMAERELEKEARKRKY